MGGVRGGRINFLYVTKLNCTCNGIQFVQSFQEYRYYYYINKILMIINA